MVPLKEIQEHDYDLAFNTYKETVREAVQYDAPEVILSRCDALVERISSGMLELKKLIAK